VISLLLLCKTTRKAIAPTLRSLELPWDCGHYYWSVESLRGLLQQTTNLQRLCIKSESLGEQSAMVLLLREGLLPCLAELRLTSYRKDDHIGLFLAEALEARRDLGLPPLTRVEGIRRCDPDDLRRIWACCPPDKVTYLEAMYGPALEALGEYLLAHPSFPALRSLELAAEDEWDSPEAGVEMTGVLQALGQGHAPGLKLLVLMGWQAEMGSVAPLGHAIREGKLPYLSYFYVLWCQLRSEDFRAIVDGLRAGPVQLQCSELSPYHRSPMGGDVPYLADALAAGGGLGQLEELRIGVDTGEDDAIVEALTGGAPCARTLQALSLDTFWGHDDAVYTLLKGLGEFPRLTKLELEVRQKEPRFMHALARALISLKAKGAPSRLAELRLELNTYHCLDELGYVFNVQALPHLTTLEITDSMLADSEEGVFFSYEPWFALRSKIKMERLGLLLSLDDKPEAKEGFLKAIADPRFFPSLLELTSWPYGVSKEEVEAAFETRWQKKREAQEE
jgi:hypothetical protein